MRRSAALTGVLILLPAIAAAASAPSAAPYDPSLDGWRQLQAAGRKAAADNRRVLIIVGGNWCKWCRALDRLMAEDAALRGELASYEVVHLNYSKENKNPEAMAHLGNPEKLGFPSLLVLSPQVQVLHTQSSEIFETGDPEKPGHDPAKLLAFLRTWASPG
jgi:thiol:disulfide interchange protein